MENNRAGKQDIPDQARSRRERVHENVRPKRNRIAPPNAPSPRSERERPGTTAGPFAFGAKNKKPPKSIEISADRIQMAEG